MVLSFNTDSMNRSEGRKVLHSFIIFFGIFIVSFGQILAQDLLPDSISTEDIRLFIKNIEKDIPIKKAVNVIYFLDKDFCYRCIAGEITGGWLNAPSVISSHLGLYSIVFDKSTGVKKNLEKPLPKNFKTINCGMPKHLIGLTESAVMIDSTGKLLYWYRIGKKSFQLAYSIADSVMAPLDTMNISTASPILATSHLPLLYSKNVTGATILSKRIQFFSKKSNEMWLFDAQSGGMLRHDTLYPTPKVCIDSKIPIKEYDQLFYTSDTTALVEYIYHHSPVDTILFNEEGIFYRKNSQRIDVLSGGKMTVIVDSFQADHIAKYSDFLIQSLTSQSVGWRTSYKYYNDTSSTFVIRFTKKSEQVDSIVLPNTMRPLSDKHCTGYDSTLWWFSTSKQFHRLSPSKSVLTTTLSYTLDSNVAYTHTDGETISVVSEEDSRRKLVGYTRMGLRSTPIIYIPTDSIGYITKDTILILSFNTKTTQWELNKYTLLVK